MTIIEKLASLGFTNTELIGEARGKSTVKIRTTKGWVYEKFATIDDVARWAVFHEPEDAA
jgi:hypothetical protein